MRAMSWLADAPAGVILDRALLVGCLKTLASASR
jgi:hypothetical protein